MRYSKFIVASVLVLAWAGVSWAALPTPTMVWEMENPSGASVGWGRTNYVDDSADTVLIGSRGGLYEIDTAGAIVGQTPADIHSATKLGSHIYMSTVGASPNYWSGISRINDDWTGLAEQIDPTLYGFDGAGPNISSDGTYLYMGSYLDASPSIGNQVRKLEITAGSGGDPFGINVVWTSTGIAKKGLQPVRYSSFDDNIYSAQGADNCYVNNWVIGRVSKDAVGDGAGEGVATPGGLGIGTSFTLPPYQDVQRYGDHIFLASGASGDSVYGLSSVNVYEFKAVETPPNVLDNTTHQQFEIQANKDVFTVAVHGNGTDTPEGFWVTTRRDSDNVAVLRYYTFGSIPPAHNRGDVTDDDFVGADDLVRILTHWGESGSVPWENGDCAPYGDGSDPGDDFVGADDYVEVLTYWGTDYSSPEPTPEPATMLVLAFGSGLALLRRSR